jgi:hypothetical protein
MRQRGGLAAGWVIGLPFMRLNEFRKADYLDPPSGHAGRPTSDLPACPPRATTTIDFECWIPHETTRSQIQPFLS